MKKVKSIFCLLLACILGIGCIPIVSTNDVAFADSYEYAMFPMDCITITQGVNGSYSHQGTYAIDMVGAYGVIDNAYAPFTGRVHKYQDSYGGNYVFLQSVNPVHFANGTVDYMTIMCIHDNDTSDLYEGQIIPQGQAFFQEGTSGLATGAHIHMECARGTVSNLAQNSLGVWMLAGSDIGPYDALYISKSTTINEGYGYNWKVKPTGYSLDVNVYQDGIMHDTGVDCCTFDVTINGSRVANDVKDYYTKDSHPEGYASGSTYKIDDIKINGCYKNNAKTSYTGTITADTEVNLEVVTYHPPKTVSGKVATCTETGLTSGTVCSKCGKVLTAQTTIPAKGHCYTSEIIAGSCTEPSKIKYTCSGCGDTYTTVPGEEWSDWSTSVPPAGAEIESKTQWSASRKDMKTSSQSSMSGYELDSSATQYGVWQNAGWTSTKPTENDVKRITETRKVVDSNAYTEYKYYHYYGYDGNTLYNSYGNYYWKNYESTVSTTAFPLDKAYDGYQGYAKNVGLHGSLWFLESTTNVPEKSHTEWFYQTRTATYTFYKWSDYGAWQDTEIKADDNTRVQTRTAYRYRLKAADVAGHTWNSGVVTTPATCTSEGVKTYTCTVCTATKTEAITKIDHTYTNKADAKYLKSSATETSAAVYYKSCSMCGVKGTETFTYGDPVPPAVVTDTVLGVSSAKTMAGKEITLTLALEKNPGIAGLSVSLNYDEAALTLKTASNGTMFSSLTSGKNFIFDNASNVTSDGTVATFTFTVNANADAGDYTVTPIVRSCVNDGGEDVAVKTEKGTVTVIDFIYGDANDDEMIDMKDVVLLRRYLAEFDYETNSSPVEIGFGADANGDDEIDMKDVVLLRRYLAEYDYETDTSSVVLGPQ